jgi:hypothetical protein
LVECFLTFFTATARFNADGSGNFGHHVAEAAQVRLVLRFVRAMVAHAKAHGLPFERTFPAVVTPAITPMLAGGFHEMVMSVIVFVL